MEKEIFLETAQRIGERLVESAIWSDGGCTWMINIPDRKNRGSKKSVKEPADVGIYQGVSGIALFLLELYKITGGANLRRTIEAALRYVKLKSKELPNNNFAFHGGRVGVGYTFYGAYEIFQNEEYLKIGLELFDRLKGNESKDSGLDVIAGAAGAIPVLLKMREISENEFETNIAIALGENLIKRARFEPIGWSWDGSNAHVKNLCGYAHGAAGMGHAFIELYNFTGKEKYLYAAEQAFLYERQFFNEEELNCPDFRYSDLSNFIYEQRMDELTKILKNDELPSYELKYMSAWCHGSPGIALSRIRAWEITQHAAYKREAELAVEGVKRSLANGTNYSLCHGIGGNCEALIYAEEVLNDKNALLMAEEFAVKGIKEYEEQNKPWACGTMGGVSDPSLMLGEAGIGYFLLRLFSNDVDSVLVVHPSKNEMINTTQNDLEKVREEYTDHYFKATKKYIKTFQGQPEVFEYRKLDEMIGEKQSDVVILYNNIENFIKSLPTEEKEKLEDFFQLEKERYLQTLELTDYTEEYRHDLVKPEAEQIDWPNSVLCLSNTSKTIEQKYDWANWLDKLNEKNLEELNKEEQHYLLYKQNNQFHIKKLNPFLTLLFNTIRQPISFAKLVEEINIALEDSTSDIEALKEIIKQQLMAGYNSNIIEVENENT